MRKFNPVGGGRHVVLLQRNYSNILCFLKWNLVVDVLVVLNRRDEHVTLAALAGCGRIDIPTVDMHGEHSTVTLLPTLVGDYIVECLLRVVAELHGEEQMIVDVGTAARIFCLGLGVYSLHVAESEGG